MNVEGLRDLFVSELHRAYAAERRLADELATLEDDLEVDALDDRGDGGLRESLREAVADHRSETEDQADRLEAALEDVDGEAKTRSTPALDGIIEEKEAFNNVVLDDTVRPLYYLWTAQRIERQEVTAYEQLTRIGEHLDVPDDAVDALEQTLSEEVDTLERLEDLARGEDVEALLDDLAE